MDAAERNDETAGPVALGYVLEEQVGHLLRRAHQRHVAIFQDKIGDAGLTPPQFATLVKIIDCGRVTQNLLGRMVAIDPATTQGIVRRLIARGLVLRRHDPMDRRTIVLSPTPAGLDLAARAVACAKRASEAAMAPLAAEERQVLLSLLRKLT